MCAGSRRADSKCFRIASFQFRVHVRLALIRQGPSGPAFRTRAAGALETTGHSISQYQVQQEGQ